MWLTCAVCTPGQQYEMQPCREYAFMGYGNTRCVQCREVFTTEHIPEGGGVEAWRKGTQPISAKGRQRVIDTIAVALLLLTVVWFWARCAR